MTRSESFKIVGWEIPYLFGGSGGWNTFNGAWETRYLPRGGAALFVVFKDALYVLLIQGEQSLGRDLPLQHLTKSFEAARQKLGAGPLVCKGPGLASLPIDYIF